jgi:hypothetical protein
MYKVEIKKIEDEDGYGDSDYRKRLVITHNDVQLREYYDGGEPEDNSFGRDWSWIKGELERAYELGRKDEWAEHAQPARG